MDFEVRNISPRIHRLLGHRALVVRNLVLDHELAQIDILRVYLYFKLLDFCQNVLGGIYENHQLLGVHRLQFHFITAFLNHLGLEGVRLGFYIVFRMVEHFFAVLDLKLDQFVVLLKLLRSKSGGIYRSLGFLIFIFIFFIVLFFSLGLHFLLNSVHYEFVLFVDVQMLLLNDFELNSLKDPVGYFDHLSIPNILPNLLQYTHVFLRLLLYRQDL